MASPFDEIDAAGQAAITSHLGEAIAFEGVVSGDYSRTADTARPYQEAVGIVAISPRGRGVTESSGMDKSQSQRTYQNSEIWMSDADFAALYWRPQRDDIAIINPGASNEKRLTISAVMPLDHGDVQIILAEGQR